MSDYDTLARDLIERTERATERVCRIAVDTGVTFQVSDIVQAVEDDLPPDYPMPLTEGIAGRRTMIARIATDVLSGEMYDD